MSALATNNVTNWERYQPGRDLFNSVQAMYGYAAAGQLASAAASGDNIRFQRTFSDIRQGNSQVSFDNDSFGQELIDQLYNNPFQAPIEQVAKVASNSIQAANDGASKVAVSLLSNPYVLLAVVAAGAGAFAYFGGFKLLANVTTK